MQHAENCKIKDIMTAYDGKRICVHDGEGEFIKDYGTMAYALSYADSLGAYQIAVDSVIICDRTEREADEEVSLACCDAGDELSRDLKDY